MPVDGRGSSVWLDRNHRIPRLKVVSSNMAGIEIAKHDGPWGRQMPPSQTRSVGGRVWVRRIHVCLALVAKDLRSWLLNGSNMRLTGIYSKELRRSVGK